MSANTSLSREVHSLEISIIHVYIFLKVDIYEWDWCQIQGECCECGEWCETEGEWEWCEPEGEWEWCETKVELVRSCETE